MKKYGLISVFIVFFATCAYGQAGWSEQTSPSSSLLLGVYALDSMNVWAVGHNGLIIHTTDGGVTWDSVSSGTERDLNTVEFINADTGFVAGEEAESSPAFTYYLVQRTTDGGLNWDFQDLPGGGGIIVMDMDFIKGPPGEPMRGYGIGGLSHAWRTDNLGDSWEHVRGGCGEGNFNSCYFADSTTGWFVGTPSNVKPYTIMFTADGGGSFVEQTSPVDIKLNGVCFGTDLKGIAVGNAGTIIYTNDGGANWEQCTDDDIKYITWFSVFLTETGKAWAVGADGKIIYSTDWGHTWDPQASGVSQPLWEVYFINDNEGWIVGGLTGSVILHTTNGGIAATGIRDFHEDQGKPYSLEQNKPNPFRTSTQIRYTLARSGNIALKIFDLSGRKVQTLVNEYQPAGEHSVDWDAGHFSNGLYFYELEVDNHSMEIKKMVLAR